MSEVQGEVETTATDPAPEILVYSLGGQYLGCTINRLIVPGAANISGRYRTRMVLARSLEEMSVRITNVLIQQYGMTQEEAHSFVPENVTPMAAVGQVDPGLYLEVAGGEMEGPLLLAHDPLQPLEAATQQFVLASIESAAGQPPAASDALPQPDGSASAGTAEALARGDHVHPTDVSRYAASNPAGYQTASQVNMTLMPYALTTSVPAASTALPQALGTAAAGTATAFARGDHVHPASRRGTTTNDNAAAGDIGEFISASVQPGSGLAVTTGVAIDITSISLTAGDWDLHAHVGTQVAAGGHAQNMQVWMSTTSKTPPTQLMGGLHQIGGVATGGIEQLVLPTGRMRQSLAATTTVYLSATVGFTGTATVAGYISARRMR